MTNNTSLAAAVFATALHPQMIRPKFYTARRCTRWDPYPQPQPLEVVAHDWQGFWAFDVRSGQWFKTPTSYNLQREITKAEADAALVAAPFCAGIKLVAERASCGWIIP